MLLWAPLRGFLGQRPVVVVVARHEELEGLGGRRWWGRDRSRSNREHLGVLRTLASVVRPSGKWGRQSHRVLHCIHAPNSGLIKSREQLGGFPILRQQKVGLFLPPPPLCPQNLYCLSANLGYFLTPPSVRTSYMEAPLCRVQR